MKGSEHCGPARSRNLGMFIVFNRNVQNERVGIVVSIADEGLFLWFVI